MFNVAASPDSKRVTEEWPGGRVCDAKKWTRVVNANEWPGIK